MSLIASLGVYLANLPLYTIGYLQVWRILTAPIAEINVISFIFDLLLLYLMAVGEEPRIGSARLLMNMAMRSLIIQLAVACIGLMLLFAGLFSFSAGIFPIVMVSLTINCLKRGEELTDCCCFIVKNKYRPPILVAIITIIDLFFGFFPIDIIAAWLLGWAIVENPSVGVFLEPSASKVERLESWLRSLDGKLGTLYSEQDAARFDQNAEDQANGTPMFNNPFAQPPAYNQPTPPGMGMQGGPLHRQGHNYQHQPDNFFTGRGVQIGGQPIQQIPQSPGYPLPPGSPQRPDLSQRLPSPEGHRQP